MALDKKQNMIYNTVTVTVTQAKILTLLGYNEDIENINERFGR